MKKTLIKIFILSVFILFAHSIGVYAEGIEWSFNEGVLTVSGIGAMTDYERVGERPWEEYMNETEKLIISEGITSVGDWSFADFTAVKEINLPNSLKSIGVRAFYNCCSVEHIKVPKNVEGIKNGAFNSCSSAVRVDLPDSLKIIDDSAFMNLPNLNSLIVPENVHTIGNWAFFGNTSLAGLYFAGKVPENMGNYLIANINENYTIYYNSAHYEQWKEKNYFDSTHTLVYDEKSFIPVYVNNVMINFDSQPTITKGRTLVPVRAVFEAMGAVVGWDSVNRAVAAERNGVVIIIPIDSDVMYKNEEQIKIDVPAVISNDRTLVPVRAISEAFGAEVTWDNFERAVYVNF